MNEIDEFINRRNQIQFRAEDLGKGDECWQMLGIANRHIDRLLDAELPLTQAVQSEIENCLNRAEKQLG